MALYSDRGIECDEEGITIRRYYFPTGNKRLPYSAIKQVKQRELSRFERWRLWGPNDLRHWFNLDLKRPRKTKGIVPETSAWVRVVLTPDDTEAVQRILEEKTRRPS